MRLFPILFFTATLIHAQQIVDSNIDDVTVYLRGAKVTRTATASLKSGSNEIVLTGLSPEIDDSSIQVSNLEGLGLSGLSYQVKAAQEKVKTNSFNLLQVSIDSTTNAITVVDAKLAGLNEESLILQSNRSLGGSTTGLSLAQVKSFGDYYNQRTEEISIARSKLNTTRSQLADKLQKLKSDQTKLDPESNGRQGEITLKLYGATAKKVNLKITYNVENAGWVPLYDIRADGKSAYVNLDFKGQIYQQTGTDWKNVNVKLSTSDPNVDNTKPVLEPKRLRFINYSYSSNATTRSNKKYNPTVKNVRGKITDPEGEPILGATVMVRGTNNATTTDFDGNYSLEIPRGSELVINFSGYDRTTVPIYASVIDAQLSTSLEAVVVAGYRTRTRRETNDASSVVTETAPEVVQSIEDNIAARTYQLSQKYTIASTGETVDINISSNKVAATYEYYTAPVINENVFLTAILKDYEKLNLIPGEANVYFDDSYSGKIYFDTDTVEEDLVVSLGVDPQITVKREDQKDTRSKSFLGSNTILEKRYVITLKNNRNTDIKVKLEDRIPISANSDIKVDDVETGNAAVQSDEQILTWMVDIASGAQVKREFSYQVKYPKGRRINEK
ncbi:hypothetical protein AAU57_06840 [Nonlabens sp. YIK11]|uniref:mucoidy inhibitor MuiA family protein n=1 Tax=Nonlabens sp. YIK11 TaxID=1453349 RepID=UPI0006DCF94C|nr:mucoidy inhibitor MuiA family protein [Nonlabens sp. YIK11]KQC33062.1 hypothetical protein AAU57_06840 [Nonlabens sp. YIK11]